MTDLLSQFPVKPSGPMDKAADLQSEKDGFKPHSWQVFFF